jgi:rare lipoprotein A
MRRAWIAVALFLAYSCTTTAPPPQKTEVLRGVASWYGQEFAGRTTANGEIFDPMLLTAAHRTLPFGTILDVVNPKAGKTVRVRINDRGPYVGNRLIDLSYAAAKMIDLIEPGSGEVDLNVVAIGKGDREPPAPYSVTVAEAVPMVTPPAPQSAPAPVVEQVPAIVENVQVIEERAGVETRKQVAADGKTIETVPVTSDVGRASARPDGLKPVLHKAAGRFLVQVGAFGEEKNAVALQQKLRGAGFESFIDHGAVLHKVQLGPYETRDQAVKTRGALEAAGVSAIILTTR